MFVLGQCNITALAQSYFTNECRMCFFCPLIETHSRIPSYPTLPFLLMTPEPFQATSLNAPTPLTSPTQARRHLLVSSRNAVDALRSLRSAKIRFMTGHLFSLQDLGKIRMPIKVVLCSNGFSNNKIFGTGKGIQT